MSSGRPLNHKIWHLAWPMIISNISVPLLGIIDTAILGHLENAQFLAAVAVGGTVLSFLYWGFGFLRMGTTGLTAQARGHNSADGQQLIIFQSMILGAGLGMALLLLSPALIAVGLWLVPPPPQAETLAHHYLAIRIFSAPAVMINFAIVGWFIGRQNTRLPLLITVFTNLVNIVLDLVFIIGLGLNSEGAALATLIAEYSGCLLALMLLKRHLNAPGTDLQWVRLRQWADYRRLIRVNRHLFIRTVVLLAGFAFFTAKGAAQGENTLAANTILMQLLLLVSYGLDGFAHAAEALVGEATGRRDRRLFLNTCSQCLRWSLLTAAALTALYAALGPTMVAVMTSIEPVQHIALQHLAWVIILPLVAMPSYLLDGIFIGATQTRSMQNTMMLAAGLVYLPAWYLSQPLGNHGLWLAFILFNAARGVFLGWRFHFYNQRQCWW